MQPSLRAAPATRGSVSHSIFGPPLPELSISQLPTRGDVGRHFLFLKENKYAFNKEVLRVLRQLLTDLWNTASILPQSLNQGCPTFSA